MEENFNVDTILVKGMKPIYSKDDNNDNNCTNRNVFSEDTYIVLDENMYLEGANVIWS